MRFSNICTFFILVPYISVYPLGSDIQPLCGLLCLIYIILKFNSLKFSFFDISFFLIALFTVINFNRYNNEINFDIFRKHFSLIFAFIIFYYGRVVKNISIKTFYFSLFVYFLFIALQVLHPSFYWIIKTLLVNSKYVELGTQRGFSSCAPEPTDFGFTMFCFLIISTILFKDKSLKRLKIFSSLFIFISVSSSGFISFIIYQLVNLNKLFKTKLFYLISVPLLIMIFYFDMRPFYIFKTLITDPLYIIGNTNLSIRFVSFSIGILYFIYDFTNIFGTGVGSCAIIGPQIFDYFNFSESLNLNTYYSSESLNSLRTGQLSSSFATLIVEHGVIGVILLVIILHKLFFNKYLIFKNKVVLIIMFSLYLFQSFPLSYTYPWFILGLISNSSIMNEK